MMKRSLNCSGLLRGKYGDILNTFEDIICSGVIKASLSHGIRCFCVEGQAKRGTATFTSLKLVGMVLSGVQDSLRLS